MDDLHAYVQRSRRVAWRRDHFTESLRPAVGVESGGGQCGPVLLCASCEHPIANGDHIYRTQATSAARAEVYSYEVELLDGMPPLWAYSATNPNGNRFDIIRISPYANTARTGDDVPRNETSPLVPSLQDSHSPLQCLVDFEGPYSNEHSFFVGYAWCMCTCVNCGQFLGWGFAPRSVVDATTIPDSPSSSHTNCSFFSSSTDDAEVRRAEHEPSDDRFGSNDSHHRREELSARDNNNSNEEEMAEEVGNGDLVMGGGGEYEIHFPIEFVRTTSDANYRRHTSSDSRDHNHDDEEEEQLGSASFGEGEYGCMSAMPHARPRGRVDPMPEFVGLIVTRCTGKSQYPLVMHQRAIQALPFTRYAAQLASICRDSLRAHYSTLERHNLLTYAIVTFNEIVSKSRSEWKRGGGPRAAHAHRIHLHLLRRHLRHLVRVAHMSGRVGLSPSNPYELYYRYLRAGGDAGLTGTGMTMMMTTYSAPSDLEAERPPNHAANDADVEEDDRQSEGCSSTEDSEELLYHVDEEEPETSGYEGESSNGD